MAADSTETLATLHRLHKRDKRENGDPPDGNGSGGAESGTSPSAERLLALNINGEALSVAAPAHFTLLEVLRYRLDLIGSKQGCDKGNCGACTVQLDGKPVCACLTLAVTCEGRNVRTVEALSGAPGKHGNHTGRRTDHAEPLHPIQDAFDRFVAAQCGFCTPGILMSADALLRERAREVNRDEVAAALAGNLCRCTGYTKILDAVVDASRVMFGERDTNAADADSLDSLEDGRT